MVSPDFLAFALSLSLAAGGVAGVVSLLRLPERFRRRQRNALKISTHLRGVGSDLEEIAFHGSPQFWVSLSRSTGSKLKSANFYVMYRTCSNPYPRRLGISGGREPATLGVTCWAQREDIRRVWKHAFPPSYLVRHHSIQEQTRPLLDDERGPPFIGV